MMLLAVLREVAGCYLTLTLAATGLSKARAWRATSLGIVRECVISQSMALPIILGLCTTEIVLAALVASREIVKAAGLATAALFLIFACYKVAVVIRTGKDACSCTGTTTMFKATRPGIIASLVSSLIQATCGFLWAFGPAGTGVGLSLLTTIALAVPLVAFLGGLRRGGTRSNVKQRAERTWRRTASPTGGQ